MRPTLALIATLAAVISGAAAGSAPADSVEANVTAAAPDVSYLFHITFELTYEVTWRETTGSPTGECVSWRIDRGSNTVVARDAPWKRKGETKARRHGIPGSINIFGRFQPTGSGAFAGGWASGTAVGAGRATVRRSWGQVGEDCINNKVTPIRPTPDDCGRRAHKTRAATVLPQMRGSVSTLDDATLISRPRANAFKVFSFYVSPDQRQLYRSCMTSRHALEHPAYVGFPIDGDDLRGLRNLQPGESYSSAIHLLFGECENGVPLSRCEYSAEVEWTIRRWTGRQADYP